jgi:hypothetical protein
MVSFGTIGHRCYAGPAAEGVSGTPRRLLRGRRVTGRIEDLLRQLGRLEGRLELSERTESTLREDLERERRQYHEDLERERQERLEAQKTAEALERDRIRLERERLFWDVHRRELEEALQAERSKGFWARLFGR